MTKQSTVFVMQSDSPVESVGEGIQRQILGFGPSIMMTKATFQQDSVGDIHSHEHAQVTYVESGAFEFSIDGELKLLQAGDACYIPPNSPHGSLCKSPGVLIDTFSPMREDFLDTD